VLEGELQAEATRQQEKVAELQAQLAQKEQAAEHYKGQVRPGHGSARAAPCRRARWIFSLLS